MRTACELTRRGLPISAVGGGPGHRSTCSPPLRRDLRHLRERLRDLRSRVLVVLQLPGEVGLVSAAIEVAVAREVEEERLTPAVALTAQGLVDRNAHGMRGLGCRHG